MKKIANSICLIFLLISGVYAGKINYNWSNADRLKFEGFNSKLKASYDGYIVDPDAAKIKNPNRKWIEKEIARWKQGSKTAIALLPEDFVKKICPDRQIKIYFYIDQRVWVTGFIDKDNCRVFINLKPSSKRPDWITWELLVINGFSDDEILLLMVHEYYHLFNPGGSILDSLYQDTENKEPSPSDYGRAKGKGEDAAESFCFYVLWPEYMKIYAKRYEIMKNLLGKEYDQFLKIPKSYADRINEYKKSR